MVRALLSQPVGFSVPAAPPPGVIVLVASPPSLLLLLSPALLLPPVVAPLLSEPGVAPPDLLPPQPALSRTDVRARAQVSESTFRNIAIVVMGQSRGRGVTSKHLLTNKIPRSHELRCRVSPHSSTGNGEARCVSSRLRAQAFADLSEAQREVVLR